MLQKLRDRLQKQLSDIAAKINSGIIPNPEDFDLPDIQGQGAHYPVISLILIPST